MPGARRRQPLLLGVVAVVVALAVLGNLSARRVFLSGHRADFAHGPASGVSAGGQAGLAQATHGDPPPSLLQGPSAETLMTFGVPPVEVDTRRTAYVVLISNEKYVDGALALGWS
eukprot:RCo012111